jgi:hypothetical protein
LVFQGIAGILLKWVVDFDVHGNIVNKSDGPACSTDAPENVEQVTAESIILSKATCDHLMDFKEIH